MFKFTVTITFPALDRLVDFLVTQSSDQTKIDALTVQLAAVRSALNTSRTELAKAVGQNHT